MKKVLIIILSVSLSLLLLADEKREKNKIPEEALIVLGKAVQFELYSLDPVKDNSKDGFHGYKVLGKTEIKEDDRNKIIEALTKGMENAKIEAKCFEPRHGIRATHEGKTVDLIICFKCFHIHLYMGTLDQVTYLIVTKEPEPVFDKVLKDAGITKAK